MGAEKRINKKDIDNSTPFVASYYKVFRVFEEISKREISTKFKEIISLKDEYYKIRRNSLNLSLETGVGAYVTMYNNISYD